MRRLTILLAMIFALSILGGCFTMNHTVGTGGVGGEVAGKKRQWYFLWGLVPLGGPVDGGQMAGGAANFTVKSQQTPVDVLLNLVTGFVTIYSRTIVTTTK
ncbi:MAG: hypothetical protein SGI97_00945 [candidate division Zixibacteria bacterium]|nr:hypothetical protein [candidate division Zixibacteria bacterium]